MQPTLRPLPCLSLLLALALGACSDSEDSTGTQPGAVSAAEAQAPKRGPRDESEDVRELRRLVDLGRVDEAIPLLKRSAGRLGIEAELINARLHALRGDDTEVVRAIERARAFDARDARVYATMVELSAAGGRIETARTELERGLAAVGTCPELTRAQGVLQLCQAGGARRGVLSLESALRVDPALPFCDRALAQGHLLLAKEALAAGRPTAALESVQRSLSFEPEEVETRRVFADVLGSQSRFEEAIAIIGELVDEGEPLQGELALLNKKAGIASLIPVAGESDAQRADRRDLALGHLARARELGLTDEELASGALILQDEARRLADSGADAYAAGDLAGARADLERALLYDPGELSARNHLAVVLYRLEDYAEAARQWREVMVVMESEGLVPPEPIHLNLAQAQVQDGDLSGARGTLERWLERNESNAEYAEYVALTREALARM